MSAFKDSDALAALAAILEVIPEFSLVMVGPPQRNQATPASLLPMLRVIPKGWSTTRDFAGQVLRTITLDFVVSVEDQGDGLLTYQATCDLIEQIDAALAAADLGGCLPPLSTLNSGEYTAGISAGENRPPIATMISRGTIAYLRAEPDNPDSAPTAAPPP